MRDAPRCCRAEQANDSGGGSAKPGKSNDLTAARNFRTADTIIDTDIGVQTDGNPVRTEAQTKVPTNRRRRAKNFKKLIITGHAPSLKTSEEY